MTNKWAFQFEFPPWNEWSCVGLVSHRVSFSFDFMHMSCAWAEVVILKGLWFKPTMVLFANNAFNVVKKLHHHCSPVGGGVVGDWFSCVMNYQEFKFVCCGSSKMCVLSTIETTDTHKLYCCSGMRMPIGFVPGLREEQILIDCVPTFNHKNISSWYNESKNSFEDRCWPLRDTILLLIFS